VKLDEMDGKKIKSLSWIDPEYGFIEFDKEGESAVLSAEYYGDHKELWAVVFKGDIEIGRYNMRFVDTITWEGEEPIEPRTKWQRFWDKVLGG